jgi:iron complex transport system permease protein
MKRFKPSAIRSEHPGAVVAGLGTLLVSAALLSLLLGRYSLALPEIATVILNIRLPRIAMACIVGCSLAAAGAAYQGVFQNPMASPDILGATQGAAFGAALALLLGMPSQVVTAFSFAVGMAAVGLVWFIGMRTGGKRVLGLILTGIMIGSLFSAGTSFLKLVADPSDQLPAITYWLMGSLVGTTGKNVLTAAVPIAVGLAPLLIFRWRLNILTMGDDEAQSLGVEADKLRKAIVLCSTLVTAAAVSMTGMIGWVGLVVPHLARRLVGNDYRYLMPSSMLLGALFLLLVDNLARSVLSSEIPIGILTAFIGAPFFLYLITKGGEKY